MPKAQVVFDNVSWSTGSKKTEDFQRHRAARGETVDLPQKEFDRLSALGAIGDESEVAQAQAVASGTGSSATDEELNGYSVDQMSAYLGQNPGEVDRVETLENARSQPRKGVLEAIEAHRS